MHRIFGHRNFLAENGPKVHFRFSAERLLSPKQHGRNVVMTQTETATCTCLSEATCLRCGRISVYLRMYTVLDPRYKDHYLDVEIKQRAREMIQAAMDAENPRGDGAVHGAAHSAGEGDQSAEKRLVSLHQMRGTRCLICSVKSCKKVPQILGRLFCS